VLPTDVLPVALQTAKDYRAAAYFYYVRESFSDAEAMIDRANELTHAERPAMPPPFAMSPAGVVRVGGSIKEPRKIQDVRPIFPAVAAASGMEGVVTLRAIVTRDGTVGDAVITSGGSVFDTAALDAVRQWLFTPTELNGVPIEVLMDVTISFKKN
jgi:TonB family protein